MNRLGTSPELSKLARDIRHHLDMNRTRHETVREFARAKNKVMVAQKEEEIAESKKAVLGT